MFVYYFISVLKCQVLMFGFHPCLIDVASVMFSEECCYFILLSLEHIQTVLCLQGSGLISAAAQLDSWCYSHVYLFVTDFYWVAPPRYFPSFSWFPMFCFVFYQEGFCECVVLGKGCPWTIWPCRAVMLPTWKKKSIICGSLWCCDFSSQVAFISLCRRKRRF